MRHWRSLSPHLQAALVAGGIVGLACLLMPDALFEAMVVASGVPAVLAAAEPPLGLTARTALALALGGAIGGFVWLGLVMLDDEDAGAVWDALRARLPRMPVRGDHAPRPPVYAHRDLGTPFLEVHAPVAAPANHTVLELEMPAMVTLPLEPQFDETAQPLPKDLDLPLAAYAPVAPTPSAPPVPELVPPLVVPAWVAARHDRPQLIDPGDRFETFALTPAPAAVAAPVAAPAAPSLRAAPSAPLPTVEVAPETESSISTLLARLERGLGRETAPPVPGSIADTLGDLRRLAVGG